MIAWPTNEICEAGDCKRAATHNVMAPQYAPYMVWLVCLKHVSILRGIAKRVGYRCRVWRRGKGQHAGIPISSDPVWLKIDATFL